MKKAELSINMIIVAVIAIVILVIVIFMVIDAFGNQKKATNCPKNGGVCVDKCEPGGEKRSDEGYLTCPDVGQICCNPGSVIL